MRKALATALLILLGSVSASPASERLCGWLEATSFGPNWKNNYVRLFLSDRDGHHSVEEAGGTLPDLSNPSVHHGEIIRDRSVEYLYGEGWSGNFCACMTARMDGRTIVEFRNFKIQNIAICRADPDIQRYAPR
ncbi:DUF4087 domain-containing protein [Manganibacter manganicus]|uniref:DUF4087 domain-containing protein n=1 Tax=Manganibacter manganicus TaxID=1873176 RepID=UPI0013020497|nr:DUF4087 domain-containing protein [Pseudaminobacter manganicus]